MTLEQILCNLKVEETIFQMSHERKAVQPTARPQRVWRKMWQTYTRSLWWHYCAHRISKHVKTTYGIRTSGKKFKIFLNNIPPSLIVFDSETGTTCNLLLGLRWIPVTPLTRFFGTYIFTYCKTLILLLTRQTFYFLFSSVLIYVWKLAFLLSQSLR